MKHMSGHWSISLLMYCPGLFFGSADSNCSYLPCRSCTYSSLSGLFKQRNNQAHNPFLFLYSPLQMYSDFDLIPIFIWLSFMTFSKIFILVFQEPPLFLPGILFKLYHIKLCIYNNRCNCINRFWNKHRWLLVSL